MSNTEVFFDEKQNDYLFLNRIKEKLENEKITETEYREKLQLFNIDKPEPLTTGHFHLPLGMWMVGLLISLFCFLAEIISNWIRKGRAGRVSDTEGAEVEVPDKAREEVQDNLEDIEDVEDKNVNLTA